MPDFKEKYGSTALITGASSGIGQAFARDLAAQQINLVVVARRIAKLNKLKQELEQAHGISVLALEHDLSLPQAAGDIYLQAEHAGFEVDILINNAGFGSYGKFDEVSRTRELAMVDLNCRAAVELTHLFLPKMKQRKRGAIVFVSSVLGFIPLSYMSTYSATKAFDLLFAESLYGELKQSGVDVICICPGRTKTEFHQASGADQDEGPIKIRTAEQVVQTTWRALGKKPTVVDGSGNKVATYIARLLPRKWLVSLLAKRPQK